MSNAYSILHNFDNQPLYSPDFGFIQTALASKQTKLDVNRAKLQNLYDQFSMLKVHNEVDQEYIEGRLEKVKDITNKYASMDLSDENFASSLLSNVSQVLDDKVKTAIVSTKLIEAEDAQWAKMRQDKPELYSDLNRAYALEKSDRIAYENAEVAGTKYQGGAGFIEYRDLSKKLMENIPKLQNMLKATWIETGPNQGYFRSIDKYEAIDRNQMDAALDGLFDEKDRRQLKINGWGTYDKTPDALLKADYDSFYAPQLNEASEKVKALEVLREDPTNKGRLNEIDQELAVWKKKENDLQNFSFDNLYKNYGKEGVYQTLYNSKYKDQILDTYSYAPRLIDRDVDQVQKANVEYQQKLQEFELDKAQYQLSVEKHLWDKEKDMLTLNAKYGSGMSGATGIDGAVIQNQAGVVLGEVREFQYADADSEILENQKVEKAAIEGMKQLTGSYVSRDSYVDLKKQFSDLPGKMKRGETIVVNGRKIPVNKETLPLLLNFQDNILNETPTEKAISQGFQTTVNQVIGNLRQTSQAYAKNPDFSDMNPYELPQFNWKIEVDKKTGKAKKVPLQNPNSHNYARLLTKDKDKLTPSEKLTLETYASLHIIGDDELGMSPEMEKELFKTLRNKTLSNMPASEFSKIATSTNDVKKAFGTSGAGIGSKEVYYSPDFANKLKDLGVLSSNLVRPTVTGQTGVFVKSENLDSVNKLANYYRQLTTAKPEEKTAIVSSIRSLEQSIKNSSTMVKPKSFGTDYYLSELNGRDMEYVDEQRKREVSLNGFQTVIKNSLGGLNDEIAQLKTQYNLPTYRNPIVGDENPSYQGLKSLAIQEGVIADDFKGTIEVSPKFAIAGDGNTVKETGEVELIATTKVKGVPTRGVIATVDSEALERINFKLQPIQRSPYNANYGENANKIKLGSGGGLNNPTDAITQDIDLILDRANTLGVTSQIKNIINGYYNNDYTFSVEPIQGQYQRVVRDSQGNIISNSIPTNEVEFDYEDVSNMYETSDQLASETMYVVLMNYMDKISAKNKVSTTSNELLNKLR